MSPALLHKKAKGGANADAYAERKAVATFSNMLGLNARERAEEFAQDARRHPRARADGVTRHSILAFAPNLEVTTAQAERAARAWLEEIGADGNFVAHLHEELRGGVRAMHVHVLWSRSRRDGRLVSLSNDYYSHRASAHRVASAIFGVHEIDRVGGIDRPAMPTDAGARAEQRAKRCGTKPAWVDPAKVTAALAKSRDMRDFVAHLRDEGIEVRLSMREDGSNRGLLLRAEGAQEFLAAGSVDRGLTLPKVQAQLAANAARRRTPVPPPPTLRHSQRPSPVAVPQHPRPRGD